MKIAVTGTRGIPNIPGGVETHCEQLYPRLAAKGFDITIFRRKSYVTDQRTEYRGLHLLDLNAPRRKALEAFFHTAKAIFKARFDLHADAVHIHAVGPALLTGFARLLGLKTVFTHHGPDYNREKWGKLAKFMLRLGEKSGIENADEVIVISNAINDLVKNKYGRTDAHVIYNGVTPDAFAIDASILHQWHLTPKTYIFAMGRFVPEKNFHQLIDAFASIKQDKYHLVIAGDTDFEDDYSRGLKRKAREKGVTLTGYITGQPLHSLLANAALFVLPSSYEGLPIALLEAMSYSLPILASDIPANIEVCLPPESYFQTGNETEMADKIKTFIANPIDRTDYDMSKFNWDNIAEETAKVYAKL